MSSPLSTRDALMQAASELLVELGFSETTTAAVAKRAGVAEGTIYRHFKSKEALAEAVFEEAWKECIEEMERRLPPRTDPEARLRSLLEVGIMVFAERPLKSALCNQEHIYFANLKGGVHDLPPGALHFVELLEESMRVAQDAGVTSREVDVRLAAHFVFHGVGHLMQRFLEPGPEGDPPPLYEPDVFVKSLQRILDPIFFSIAR
jgi:AcrR family transcriptional regulator